MGKFPTEDRHRAWVLYSDTTKEYQGRSIGTTHQEERAFGENSALPIPGVWTSGS